MRKFDTSPAVICVPAGEAARLTFGFGTNEASFAMKSSGSNITWVVPSL
jgi:hypothetical protein